MNWEETKMETITNPHDRFFKQLLSGPESAYDFMRYYLPTEVVELLDLPSLALRKGSFVDRRLQEHFSDLLYEVNLHTGGGAYIYILFEHKSYPERHIAFHLLRYMVQIWEQSLKERQGFAPIVPVVIYHGQARWRVSPHFGGLFDAPEALASFVPDYYYWLCDLSRYSDEEIRGEVILRVGLLLLKYVFRDEMRDRYREILALLQGLSDSRTALAYLETVLRYLSQATKKISGEELREAVEEIFPEGGALMATIAREWLEQGIQRGRLEGLQEGRLEGRQEGRQEGLQAGLLAGIEVGLDLRFGLEGIRLLPEIAKIEDVDVLRAVQEGLKAANTPDELRRIYQN
jgi:predicted transposase/invertase (TIGR01784 family)